MSDIKGVDLGLRHRCFKEFITEKPDVPWLEIHTENFVSQDGTSAKYLAKIRQHYPISAHCIGLSLGSAANACPVRAKHLQNIKATIDWLQPSLFQIIFLGVFQGRDIIYLIYCQSLILKKPLMLLLKI